MFIGEMGCWLVVAGFSIYRRYFPKDAPLFRGGYQHVHEDDEEADLARNSRELRRSSSTGGSVNAVVAALQPNDDKRRPLTGVKVFLLALPACCDITGTTLMNVGLLFVAASIYQMTRGALVLFVGLFSVIFLRRKLYLYQWSALFIVVIGVGIVGLAGALATKEGLNPDSTSVTQPIVHLLRAASEELHAMAQPSAALQTIIGVLMIAAAQIFTATQFVLEEWILEHYALEPLKVVGWEGVFGFIVTVIGMIILHLAVGRTDRGRYGYFDAQEGWRELVTSRGIAVSSFLIMISIGGFNFFGISVTRTVSATARSTIDTSRTLFIWIVSLALGWETFKWLQIVGFALLVYGTFLFNNIVRPPLRACVRGAARKKEGEPALLADEPIAHS